MAAKRTRTISQRERRRMRIQQIVFVAIGVLALASIIVLLTWMYLTCLLLLLGGKLNAILRRERAKMREAAASPRDSAVRVA